jgi:hypothetical protein
VTLESVFSSVIEQRACRDQSSAALRAGCERSELTQVGADCESWPQYPVPSPSKGSIELPAGELGSGGDCYFLASAISSLRPLDAGGAGIVISSTPSLKLALACSLIAPSGSGITRQKPP